VIAHGLHGLAHQEIPVFSASGFVCGCCGDIGSIIAAGLLWTPTASVALAGFNRRLTLQSTIITWSLAPMFLKFPLKGGLFQVTAYLMLIDWDVGSVYWRWERFNHQRRRWVFSMILTTIVPYCSGSRTPGNAWVKTNYRFFSLQTTVAMWMASSCLSIVVMHSFK